jgi:deoxyribonuclease-4
MYEQSAEKINCFPSYVFAMAAIKKASAIVNGKIGVLDEERCRALIQACDEMIDHKFDGELISDMLNRVLTPDQTTTVLLETMAGKGSEVGRTFEELRAIIDRVELKDKLGVCMDTCHVSDGGYDIIGDLDGVLRDFDSIIGLDRLRAMHINDSMNPPSAHKDRHARIGEGHIGTDAIVRVINHPLLCHLPFYLETPHDTNDGYAKEIAMLRAAYTHA